MDSGHAAWGRGPELSEASRGGEGRAPPPPPGAVAPPGGGHGHCQSVPAGRRGAGTPSASQGWAVSGGTGAGANPRGRRGDPGAGPPAIPFSCSEHICMEALTASHCCHCCSSPGPSGSLAHHVALWGGMDRAGPHGRSGGWLVQEKDL